jgi:transposase-like protein
MEKKKKQSVVLVEEQVESQTFFELLAILKELEKEGKHVDVQVCPRCKSPRVRRVGTMSGDLWGHMKILPPKFKCEECGWRTRLVLKATNRPLGIKDVAIIAEASDLKEV